MSKILYFPKDEMICRIEGYMAADNTSNALKISECLKEYAERFAKDAGISVSDVLTHYITESSRYKHMRVFFAVVSDDKGQEFQVIENWVLRDWLTH